MPRISEMFQKPELSYTDFEPSEVYYGTIRGVTMKEARVENRGNSMAPPRPGAFGQPHAEVDWLIWFVEWPKPMRLRPQRAKIVAHLLGSDNTDDWNGKRIGFYRGIVQIGNESKEGIIFDQRPAPQLPAPDAKFLDRSRVGRVVPKADVERFVYKLKESGRTWTSFVNWLKDASPDAHAYVVGQDLDGISAVVLPAMKTYLDRTPAPSGADQAALPAGGLNRLPPGVRDQMTTAGKLEQDRASEPRDAGHEPIQEDDIPF